MQVEKTKISGLYIIKPDVFNDGRGYFFESFNHRKLKELIPELPDFVQDNQSKSSYGVVRGLHFQRGENAQAKLVRVVCGKVLDVAVDLRGGSKSFGEYVAVELTGDNKLQFFIPEGFAHGFSVLSDEVIFEYKCSRYYNKESEGGIIYNDPDLKIDWRIPEDKIVVSEKDQRHLTFKDFITNSI